MTASSHSQPSYSRWYGVLAVAMLTMLSSSIVKLPILTSLGMSPLVIAILLGIAIGNTITLPSHYTPGIHFAAKRLLRTAIILYGFRVSFQEIASVGTHALLIDIAVVIGTLGVGYLIGRKFFKLDSHLSLLISAGAAICGAAAVLAVEEIIKSEPHKTAVAVGTVVLFGTLSMFLYPFMQQAGFFGFSDHQFGVFAGASVHEVAQALVAGSNVSSEAGNIAVIVKMMRVLLLVPVLFVLSYLTSKTAAPGTKSRLTIPWFALGFVAVIAIHSMHIVPKAAVQAINQLDLVLLTMAMGAIGLETKFEKIKTVGLRPLYLAITLFAWLLLSVFLMVRVS